MNVLGCESSCQLKAPSGCSPAPDHKPIPIKMIGPHSQRFLVLLLSSAGFGLFIWLLLPVGVVVCDDDFAYLRSTVETIRRSRPWTDDWLNPWAASTTMLSAATYGLTGSFKLAVHAVLVGAAATCFFGMSRFIRFQGYGVLTAVTVTTLFLMSPSALFMSLIYTSVPVYLAALWFCLTAFADKRWGWFLAFWVVGLASRQSAVMWMALPAAVCLANLLQLRNWRRVLMESSAPIAVVATGIMIFLTLKHTMNPTLGQKVILQSLGSGFSLASIGVPFGASLVFLGIGSGISCWLAIPRSGRPLRWGARWPQVLMGCVAGAAAGFWATSALSSTQSSGFFGGPDPYLIIVAALAGGGIGLRPVRPNPLYLAPAGGITFLLCLYSGTYDYYFNELFCFGFAAGLTPVEGSTPGDQAEKARYPRFENIAAAAIVLVFAFRTSVCLKIQQDYIWASNRGYELALRDGNLLPYQVGQASFGYLGWLWEEKYRKVIGYKNFEDLAGFRMWKEHWDGKSGTGMSVAYPRWLSKPKFIKAALTFKSAAMPKEGQNICLCHAESAPLFGRSRMDVAIWRVDTGRPSPVPGDEGKRLSFPLDDSEWTQLIRQQGRWSTDSSRH